MLVQEDDLFEYTCKSNDDSVRFTHTDLRVAALDVDGLQINMEAHYKGVSAFRTALKLMGGDGQGGGAAHWLQQAQALLLAQQSVHTELAQAHRPGEGITWWKTCGTEREGCIKNVVKE